MFLNIKLFILIGSTTLIFSACGGGKQDEIDVSDNDSVSVGLDSQKISAQNVFNTISSRYTILELKRQADAEYNVQFLNNPDEVNKYSLESSRALNLGVYGADLNVASIYDQTQETMLFFKCVSILAKSIGVSNSFDENMGDRMTANQDNRDSTLSIISQAFKSADVTLRKNNRSGTSSLLIAGAWIEGLYVACQTAKETKYEPIVKEVFLQNESLTNLIGLLKSSKVTDEAAYIVQDLQSIKLIMDEKTDNVFTLDAMKKLDAKIIALRTKIVSTK
jgi:hypothetical protein